MKNFLIAIVIAVLTYGCSKNDEIESNSITFCHDFSSESTSNIIKGIFGRSKFSIDFDDMTILSQKSSTEIEYVISNNIMVISYPFTGTIDLDDILNVNFDHIPGRSNEYINVIDQDVPTFLFSYSSGSINSVTVISGDETQIYLRC